MKEYLPSRKVLQEQTRSNTQEKTSTNSAHELGANWHSPLQRKQLEQQTRILQGAQLQQQKAKQAVVLQKKNKTGLPDALKQGMERMSGISMDDVSVNYNSARPAQLQAHAYAQGNQIHLAPGQERHLPHEAWHVIQQKQGRVKPTMQHKGVNINDNAGLEREADLMGQKALQQGRQVNQEKKG